MIVENYCMELGNYSTYDVATAPSPPLWMGSSRGRFCQVHVILQCFEHITVHLMINNILNVYVIPMCCRMQKNCIGGVFIHGHEHNHGHYNLLYRSGLHL